MRRALAASLAIAAGLLVMASPVLAQAVPSDEPTLGMLATTAGLAVVIGIVMQLIRGPLDPALFDKWAPSIAVVIGIVLAELYVIATTAITGEALLQAALVGLVGGILSQNVNTVIRRATA